MGLNIARRDCEDWRPVSKVEGCISMGDLKGYDRDTIIYVVFRSVRKGTRARLIGSIVYSVGYPRVPVCPSLKSLIMYFVL